MAARFSPNKRFGPDDANTYNIAGPKERPDTTVNITDEFYNEFFNDWMAQSRSEAKQLKKLRDEAKKAKLK